MEEVLLWIKPYNLIMKIGKVSFLLIAFFALGNIFAQQTEEVEENSNTLNSHFIEVVDKSNSYQHYKVIELRKLQELKATVMDSVQALYSELQADEKIMAEQEAKVDALNAKIAELQRDLDTTVGEKDSILFMGAQIEKSAFKTIFWVVVLILLLALLFFIYKYYHSQKVTVEARRELMEAHKELEEQRRKHIKKEQKIMRQLQDEINKNIR